MRCIGIDGCKAGWLVVTSNEGLRFLEFQVVPQLAAFLNDFDEDNTRVVIDVPIGLPIDGPRLCDKEARRYLGAPRGSSVFPAPCRPTISASNYSDACNLNSQASGKKISKQTFYLLDKIREVDALMTRERQRWIREAHPELVFAMLSGTKAGLTHSKKRTAGEQERLSILERVVPHFDARELRKQLGLMSTVRDDIIDAVACLVTAQRIVTGHVVVFPSGVLQLDGRGLRMEIVA